MAIFEPGPLIGRVRGKIGGIVATNSRTSPVLRSWRHPKDPARPQQASQRSFLAIAIASWRDVATPAQRTSWAAVAARATFHNALGQAYNPTGRELYVRGAIYMQNIGLAIQPIAPLNPLPFWPRTSLTTIPAAPLMISTVGTTTGFSTMVLIAQLSPPLNLSLNQYDGPWAKRSVTTWINPAIPLQIFPAMTLIVNSHYFMLITPGVPLGIVGFKQRYEFFT